ncbi:isoprenyl transferase [Candidatus Margulisiibacteriota bacterium]
MFKLFKIFIKPRRKAKTNTPKHIAIIMDGNGRWARRRGLPRIEGHRRGAVSLKEMVKSCAKLGVKYLTVYAFSTENWKRPKPEVNFLMDLLSQTIDKEVGELKKNKVRLRFLGKIHMLPAKLQNKIKKSERRTAKNKGLQLNVCLSYGGRAEVVDAVKLLLKKRVDSGKITEKLFSKHLYTAGMPDPDLLIRTASEFRVSNFLIWQIAYSEIWITDTLWPDFREKHLLEAIGEYKKRERRFGRL